MRVCIDFFLKPWLYYKHQASLHSFEIAHLLLHVMGTKVRRILRGSKLVDKAIHDKNDH